MKKRRICIISPSTLPMPAVHGGAIETLVDMFIEENEKKKKFEITVLTIVDEDAIKKETKYKHCRFVHFSANNSLENIYNKYVYRLVKHFTGILLPDRPLRYKMVKYAKEHEAEFDWILFEAGEVDCLGYYKNMLPEDKTLLHLHWCASCKKKLENSFYAFLPISKYVSDEWMKTASDKNAQNCFIWQNCIDNNKFTLTVSDLQKKQLRKQLNLEIDDFVIIFTGRMIKEKGALELLNAISLIDDASVKLLLIGSARFGIKTNTQYERQISEKLDSLRGRVISKGYIPNSELYKYYSIADVSVIPSIFDEPAGLVVLEAMSSRKPIITTGSGGIKEYCNETCALFVERDDHMSESIAKNILYLKANPSVRNEMGEKGKVLADKYNKENYYDTFVSIINSMGLVKCQNQ